MLKYKSVPNSDKVEEVKNSKILQMSLWMFPYRTALWSPFKKLYLLGTALREYSSSRHGTRTRLEVEAEVRCAFHKKPELWFFLLLLKKVKINYSYVLRLRMAKRWKSSLSIFDHWNEASAPGSAVAETRKFPYFGNQFCQNGIHARSVYKGQLIRDTRYNCLRSKGHI